MTGRRRDVSRETLRVPSIGERWCEQCRRHHAVRTDSVVKVVPQAWARDPDPLDVTTHAGYDSGPTRRVVINERPVVDDRGMVLVWVIAAIAFLLAMGATVLLVAGRPPSG